MSHYSGNPCDINAYRADTAKGYASSGIRMSRTCAKCKQPTDANGMKKVTGSGTSRHNPTAYLCPVCQ